MAKFGAKRDKHDARDMKRTYGLSNIPSTDHHPTIDLRKYVDYIYVQGDLNSCTANALCAAYRIDLKKQIETYGDKYYYFEPSRLFLYYNSRKREYTTASNEGVSLRDAVKVLHKEGVCMESDWPYDEIKYSEKPPTVCYKSAKGNIVAKYERLKQDINQFRACLKDGSPFAFGFAVYDDFEEGVNLAGGIMKSAEEEKDTPIIGEHAVLAVGYDDTNRQIICLNSWGESWGDKGYFYMPYNYIVDEDLAFDFWKISFVSENRRPRVKNSKK